jgi:hypothetical protein
MVIHRVVGHPPNIRYESHEAKESDKWCLELFVKMINSIENTPEKAQGGGVTYFWI